MEQANTVKGYCRTFCKRTAGKRTLNINASNCVWGDQKISRYLK